MADIKFKPTKEVEDFFSSTLLGKVPVTEVALEGEPGCGKTLATRWLAAQLGVEDKYMRFVCTKETSFIDFTTEKVIQKGNIVQKDSMFIQLVQEPSLICVDECYLAQPDVMAGLNSLLDFDRSITLPDGRVVKRHEKNFIVFTSNPKSYAGVKRQHGGFLDRLPTLLMGYLDTRSEVSLIHNAYPDVPKDNIAKLVKLAQFIRQGKGTRTMSTVCSTRGLLSMAQLMTNGATLELAVRSTLKVPEEEKNVINELMGKALGAEIIRNETTGEDEIILNAKLEKELVEVKAQSKKFEEECKQWQEKAKAMFDALNG